MCGIAGFLSLGKSHDDATCSHLVRTMADTLRHRGPDDGGEWTDAASGIALGHRRLSIIDVSAEGHQPMRSASGHYVIAYNGEVYNFPALRDELLAAGHCFRGHSDTEVMLATIEAWGLVAAVRRFVGMFAFALWDQERRELHLVRDRIGIKPLYYGWLNDTLVFGSELKALHAHPDWQGEIDRDALALFMRHNCVPAPYSIYQSIYKLPPGTILTLRLARLRPGKISPFAREDSTTEQPHPKTYWSTREVAQTGAAQPFTGSEAEAIQRLDALLAEAVRARMVADVPLGAFLSGGIDSSVVVALMQRASPQPVRTFSIGFHEDAYNEAAYAKEIAKHLGTNHTELYVTPQDAMAVIPRLGAMFDEPFADSSQIPTFLVSEMTRRHVTVSLSGDGGDELFGGYNRYFLAPKIWERVAWLPLSLRRGLARVVTLIPPAAYNILVRGLSPVLPRGFRRRVCVDLIRKVSEILKATEPGVYYRQFTTHWKYPTALVLGSKELPTAFTAPALPMPFADFTRYMMYNDLTRYHPDDILVKVDRASMAVGLEARIPLMDHRVVEFAATLPMAMLIRGGEGKWLLRQVLHQYVPPTLLNRPKAGFSVPIGEWMRGELRDWAESLLDESRLRREGFFDPAPIRQKWAEHLAGHHDWRYHLWDVLMFEAWLDAGG